MESKLKFPPNYIPWYQKDNYTAHYTNGKGFITYRDAEDYCKDLVKVELFMHDSVMVSTHNMPCAVCKLECAVFHGGLFEPCWNCQEEGYKLVKVDKSWKGKFIKWLLGGL
jgi:hypothetical protein